MSGLYISWINHAVNEETKGAPSQSAWTDGFKSLLHQYTGLLYILWIPACSKFGFKLVLGEIVQRCWSWLCEQWFCLHIWVFVASAHSDWATWELSFCFLPRTCCDSVSTGWESSSFPVEVSLAYEPLLWSFISVFASLIAINKIQRWIQRCEVQWGEVMNKDENSF